MWIFFTQFNFHFIYYPPRRIFSYSRSHASLVRWWRRWENVSSTTKFYVIQIFHLILFLLFFKCQTTQTHPHKHTKQTRPPVQTYQNKLQMKLRPGEVLDPKVRPVCSGQSSSSYSLIFFGFSTFSWFYIFCQKTLTVVLWKHQTSPFFCAFIKTQTKNCNFFHTNSATQLIDFLILIFD